MNDVNNSNSKDSNNRRRSGGVMQGLKSYFITLATVPLLFLVVNVLTAWTWAGFDIDANMKKFESLTVIGTVDDPKKRGAPIANGRLNDAKLSMIFEYDSELPDITCAKEKSSFIRKHLIDKKLLVAITIHKDGDDPSDVKHIFTAIGCGGGISVATINEPVYDSTGITSPVAYQIKAYSEEIQINKIHKFLSLFVNDKARISIDDGGLPNSSAIIKAINGNQSKRRSHSPLSFSKTNQTKQYIGKVQYKDGEFEFALNFKLDGVLDIVETSTNFEDTVPLAPPAMTGQGLPKLITSNIICSTTTSQFECSVSKFMKHWKRFSAPTSNPYSSTDDVVVISTVTSGLFFDDAVTPPISTEINPIVGNTDVQTRNLKIGQLKQVSTSAPHDFGGINDRSKYNKWYGIFLEKADNEIKFNFISHQIYALNSVSIKHNKLCHGKKIKGLSQITTSNTS